MVHALIKWFVSPAFVLLGVALLLRPRAEFDAEGARNLTLRRGPAIGIGLVAIILGVAMFLVLSRP